MIMDGAVANATISDVLTSLGSVFTWLVGKVGEVFALIQTYPIALIPIGVSIAFVAVRFAKRVLGI